MSWIEKRTRGGHVTWRARWREASGRERVKTFTRKIDAQRFLVEVEDAKLRGAYVDPSAGRVPFGEWAERWYAATAALKPATRRDYRKLLDLEILPRFRDLPLAGIDSLMVREWVAGLVAGGLGPKRAGKALQVLSQVLAAAVEGGKLARNAAAGVKAPRVQRREMAFLDPVQVEQLAAAITVPFGTLVRFAAYTGLRPCELTALRVEHLDLLRGTARVCEAAPEIDGRLCWGGVKTHEARTVRLPRFLVEELAAYLAGRPHEPGDLVFTGRRGAPMRWSKWVPNHFKPAIARANEAIAATGGRLIPANLRLYDLRHTCASILIRQGASVKAVQAQLGHKAATMTLDLYGHLFPDEAEQVAARLDGERAAALATLTRPTGGTPVVRLRKNAGQ